MIRPQTHLAFGRLIINPADSCPSSPLLLLLLLLLHLLLLTPASTSSPSIPHNIYFKPHLLKFKPSTIHSHDPVIAKRTVEPPCQVSVDSDQQQKPFWSQQKSTESPNNSNKMNMFASRSLRSFARNANCRISTNVIWQHNISTTTTTAMTTGTIGTSPVTAVAGMGRRGELSGAFRSGRACRSLTTGHVKQRYVHMYYDLFFFFLIIYYSILLRQFSLNPIDYNIIVMIMVNWRVTRFSTVVGCLRRLSR